MRVTVCELAADGETVERGRRELEEGWAGLVAHVAAAEPALVVLPEMPFGPWLAGSAEPDAAAWEQSVAAHDAWLARLGELGDVTVASSRPVLADGGRRFNEAFVWDAHEGYRPVHRKTFLPDEPGFWEASWYERGPTVFEPGVTRAGALGFLVCTELWFPEEARRYGQRGADLVVCPRGTPHETLDRWVAAGRVAAVSAGGFCVSSNRAGRCGDVRFAGGGWVIDPEGRILATTSASAPSATVDIDLAEAKAARTTYPRYVDTSPVAGP